MVRDFWRLFNCLILVLMILVLANHESAEGAGLRDFLPKVGTVFRYEGTKVYRDGTKSNFTLTVQIDWRREKGRDYLVRTSKEVETVPFGLRLTEVIRMYEVTSGYIALVSIDVTRGGIPQVKSRIRLNPPQVLLQWPLREGKKWEQSILRTTEKDDGPSQTITLNWSFVARGEEAIQTPAGKFNAWRIEATFGKSQVNSWWANGWIISWQGDGPNISVSAELVEFKEPER